MDSQLSTSKKANRGQAPCAGSAESGFRPYYGHSVWREWGHPAAQGSQLTNELPRRKMVSSPPPLTWATCPSRVTLARGWAQLQPQRFALLPSQNPFLSGSVFSAASPVLLFCIGSLATPSVCLLCCTHDQPPLLSYVITKAKSCSPSSLGS